MTITSLMDTEDRNTTLFAEEFEVRARPGWTVGLGVHDGEWRLEVRIAVTDEIELRFTVRTSGGLNRAYVYEPDESPTRAWEMHDGPTDATAVTDTLEWLEQRAADARVSYCTLGSDGADDIVHPDPCPIHPDAPVEVAP